MKTKERIAEYGTEALSSKELIEFVTGIRIEEKIDNINSLRVGFTQGTDLQKQKLDAIFSLASRINTKYSTDKISSPDDAAVIMMEDMRYLQREHFKIMILDTKNNVKKISEISVGSLNSSIVHPREVFHEAIMNLASSIILVHNHPSGECEPSHEDIVLTNRLDECGKILGVRVLDHIIIGDGVYFSFKEEALI